MSAECHLYILAQLSDTRVGWSRSFCFATLCYFSVTFVLSGWGDGYNVQVQIDIHNEFCIFIQYYVLHNSTIERLSFPLFWAKVWKGRYKETMVRYSKHLCHNWHIYRGKEQLNSSPAPLPHSTRPPCSLQHQYFNFLQEIIFVLVCVDVSENLLYL